MRLGVAAVVFRLSAVTHHDGIQQGLVLVGEHWSVVVPVQDRELVAQHDDLKVPHGLPPGPPTARRLPNNASL